MIDTLRGNSMCLRQSLDRFLLPNIPLNALMSVLGFEKRVEAKPGTDP